MNYEKNKKAFQDLSKNSKPDAIIFDWDNTLVDTWPLIHSAINEAMRAFGKEEWSLKRVHDEIYHSMRESFPLIFGDDWQKAGEVYKKSYRALHLEKLVFLDGALELLDKIQEKKILQFLVSNKIGTTLRKEAAHLKVDEKFFSIVGSLDADFDKPSSSPVELALIGSNLSLNNKNIWFIGDSVADVECAYSCGFQPIIYGHEGGILKSITPELYENGKKGEGAIPLFFEHKELINLLDLL
jgi:phosphoglycolate phosphatase